MFRNKRHRCFAFTTHAWEWLYCYYLNYSLTFIPQECCEWSYSTLVFIVSRTLRLVRHCSRNVRSTYLSLYILLYWFYFHLLFYDCYMNVHVIAHVNLYHKNLKKSSLCSWNNWSHHNKWVHIERNMVGFSGVGRPRRPVFTVHTNQYWHSLCLLTDG